MKGHTFVKAATNRGASHGRGSPEILTQKMAFRVGNLQCETLQKKIVG